MLKLTVLRLAAQWRGMVTIIVGTLLAAMVASAMPLYTAAVTQIGMVQRIMARPPQDNNILIRTGIPAANVSSTYPTLDSIVRGTLPDRFSGFDGWQDAIVAFRETSDMFLVIDGTDAAFKGYLAAYEGIDAGLDWDGRPPQDIAGDEIEIGVTEFVAGQLGLAVGDEIVLDQRGWQTSTPFTARIVGIMRPRVADDDWLPIPAQRPSPHTALLTTPGTVERVAAASIPDTRINAGWWALFNHAALNYSDLDAATSAAAGYSDAVTGALTAELGASSTGITVQTKLPDILRTSLTDITALGAPFVLLLLQLGALVFYFLLVMGALVRRSERRELSVLQTRGAYRRQIMVVRGLEALLICVGAVLAAPTLARLFLTIFIPLITGIERLPLDVSAETYMFSAGAGVVALAVLLVTLWPPLNLPLIAAGGSANRSGAAAFFQKYYLDVLLLVIGLVALGQLSARDGANIERDPVLLLVPTLLFFAMSSLSLRLFPPLMNLLAGIVSRSDALTVPLAGWQVSREPLHYARITLMLALAVSVGWFGISYQRTVERNRADQAAYASGADVRLTYDTRRGNVLPDMSLFSAQDGTAAVSPAIRLTNVSLTPSGSLSLDTGTLLAVNPTTLAPMLSWRDDLGPLPLPEPVGFPSYGRTLPEGTTAISYEAQLSRGDGNGEFSPLLPAEALVLGTKMFALVVTGTGEQVVVPFAPQLSLDMLRLLESSRFNAPDIEARQNAIAAIEWVRFHASLSGLAQPISFKAITFETGLNNQNLYWQGGVLGFRDMRLLVNGTETPVDWLAQPIWQPAAFLNVDFGAQPDDLLAPEGSELSLGWAQPDDRGLLGLYLDGAEVMSKINEGPTPDGFALPAVVSAKYAATHHLEIGHKFSLGISQADVWFVVTGIATYFPTILNTDGLYIITDFGGFQRWMEARPRAVVYPNEVWVDVDGIEEAEWIANLSAVPELANYTAIVSSSGVLETLQTDLLTTGLIGLLLLSFIIALLLCAVSLATYAGITLQSRRAEFAVLRALGWTRRHIVVGILAEQGLVILTGVLLGLGIGVFLSAQVLPTLSGSDTGNVLPYAVTADPDGLFFYALLMTGLLGVQLAIGAAVIGRQTAQVIRMGGVE